MGKKCKSRVSPVRHKHCQIKTSHQLPPHHHSPKGTRSCVAAVVHTWSVYKTAGHSSEALMIPCFTPSRNIGLVILAGHPPSGTGGRRIRFGRGEVSDVLSRLKAKVAPY